MIRAMIRRLLGFGLFALLIAGGVGVYYLHQVNRRVREQVLRQQRQSHALVQLRTDDARLRELRSLADTDARAAAAAVHVELLTVRAHVADLENRAEEESRKTLNNAARLADNRDPHEGLTRLDYFQNRGAATADACFQTLVWTALQRDPAAVAKLLVVNGRARDVAESLIARLPPEQQAQWTPEKLAGFSVISTAVDVAAIQIVNEQETDAQHALITTRVSGRSETSRFAFEATASGWRLVVPETFLASLQNRMRELSSASGATDASH